MKPLLDNIKLAFSPLTNKMYLYRHGKSVLRILEKREADADIMGVITAFMMRDSPFGTKMTYRLDNNFYEIHIRPITREEHEQRKAYEAMLVIEEQIKSCDDNKLIGE